MTPRLAGLLCPVTTPFDRGGDASPTRLAAQIEIYQRLGVRGVVVLGTSGEGPLIDPEEETPLLAAARSALGSDRVLVAQVGHESLRATLASARRAEAAGADALLCLPPRYYPVGASGIARFYRAVAAACGLPLLAYHIPQRSHVDPGAEALCELASDGTLAGIKESAGDLVLQRALRKAGGRAFAIFNGSARLTLEALRGGADGAILAVADAAPESALAILEAHAAGETAAAEEAQRALEPLADCLGARFGVPGIKAALDHRGWPGGGEPRPPLAALGAAERDEVRAALLAAGVDLS
ncbi:MAG TPA: dihydrodipicolinate synthase family protein [Gemmatimonadota bacterium]|nr:dihydrodipicolinate synthase family protein [Gemmatimonadota bacterium]